MGFEEIAKAVLPRLPTPPFILSLSFNDHSSEPVLIFSAMEPQNITLIEWNFFSGNEYTFKHPYN